MNWLPKEASVAKHLSKVGHVVRPLRITRKEKETKLVRGKPLIFLLFHQ